MTGEMKKTQITKRQTKSQEYCPQSKVPLVKIEVDDNVNITGDKPKKDTENMSLNDLIDSAMDTLKRYKKRVTEDSSESTTDSCSDSDTYDSCSDSTSDVDSCSESDESTSDDNSCSDDSDESSSGDYEDCSSSSGGSISSCSSSEDESDD